MSPPSSATKKLRCFLSYHYADKQLAGKIKRNLEPYGLTVFLAHDDIKPTQTWQDRVLKELQSADVLLVLLTDDFRQSAWTSQECGFALARKTLIVSLKVSIDPFGFLSNKQALNLRESKIPDCCLKLAKVISESTKLQNRFLDGLIGSILLSDTFADAKEKTSWLEEFDGYTRRHVNSILRGAIKNRQIWQSFGAHHYLSAFIHRSRRLTDKGLVKRLRSKGSF